MIKTPTVLRTAIDNYVEELLEGEDGDNGTLEDIEIFWSAANAIWALVRTENTDQTLWMLHACGPVGMTEFTDLSKVRIDCMHWDAKMVETMKAFAAADDAYYAEV